MAADLYIDRHENGRLVLFWRLHDCSGETEYGDLCLLSEEEAAALLASTLVGPWFGVNRQPVAGVEAADPSRFIVLDEAEGWPQIRFLLPANEIRKRDLAFAYEGDLGSLRNPETVAALLERTRIADRRAVASANPGL